jgi:hypothetical protein
MFKSLLRTLPTLSGNFTLSCNIDNIYKDSSNEYHTYVKTANIIPLSNDMIYKKHFNINLLNGRYEYDVSKFYYIYKSVFYNENYSYLKNDYNILDLVSNDTNNDARNKDYEFGCKRIQYSQHGYQFNFYAPFYINNVNDLPEYFNINIHLNDHLTKKLKVYINKKDNENYLKHYLEKYIYQIDDRVIFFLPETKQATYYGIDVNEGGVRTYKDNVIGGIYDNQYTINNFDYTICQGFERNKLIMRQIIPLSFSFNLNDIFNNYEREFFKFAKIKITGNYIGKFGIEYDFYDFNIDYYEYFQQYNKYDSNLGKFIFANGEDENGIINVQNVSYPSLNEGMHTRYRFSNKMTPIYCRFKMMLSDDKDPYITNLSYGFSHLQYPSIKYGYFPTTFKNIIPNLVISNNDLKLPIGKNKTNYYVIKQLRNNAPYINTDNLDKFNQLIRNYCSSWYNEWKQSYESIDDIINDHIWTDVRYNYAYLNGVLYNFNNSMQKDKIDKFTVLLDINLNKKTIIELNNNIKKANIVLSFSDDSGIPTYDYDRLYSDRKIFSYNGMSYVYGTTLYNNYNMIKKAYINYNICMEKDDYGSYVKVNDYNKVNNYYKYEDLKYVFLNNIILNDNIELLSSNQLTGYVLLDGVNNANYFETYKDIYKNEKTRLMLYDEVFNTNSMNSMYWWLSKKLYMSTIRSSKKITVKSVYDTISDNEGSYGKVAFYLREDLVDINRLISTLIDNNISNDAIRYLIKRLNEFESYSYVPYSNDYGIQLDNYFIKKKDVSKIIYVDTYNLNKYIKEYNRLYDSDLKTIDSGNYYKEEFFVNIINKDHLKAYIKDLSKNENGVSTVLMKSFFDVIYAKERIWNINNEEMKCKDLYAPLSKIMKLKWKDLNNDLIETTNVEKIQWFLKHISDSRNQANKFEFKCVNKNNEVITFDLDLCFKKEFIRLDENLMKLLNDDKYLYLYVKDECKSINIDNWCIYNDQQLKKLDSSVYIKEINEFLMPVFTQPYINDYDIRRLSKIIEGNKLQDYTIKEYDEICFKEIDLLTSIEILVNAHHEQEFERLFRNYKNKFISTYIIEHNLTEEDNDNLQYQLDFLKESYKEVFYIDVVKNLCGIQLYSKYDILNISYNMNINKCVYDEDSKLNIYEKDGVRYGFYTISLNIDNTNNSFYIEDDFGMNILFDTINGLELNDLTIMNNFRILYQALKINIFNNFANDISLVVFPTENNIKIRYASLEVPKDEEYKYVNLKKEDTDIVYNDIKILKKDRNIKLLRYFNYIEPCIQKVSYIRNAWEHKFKIKDIFFNIDNNILNRTSLSIYRYNPLYVCTSFDKTSNTETYEYVSQLEYKHLNDNVIYNLEEEIIINEPKLVTYEKTLELQTEENIFSIFKKYILSKHNNEDIILFLFNKYKKDFESVSDKLTSNKSDKLYKVTYKFTLI